MMLTKCVNGEHIPLSVEEISEYEARQAEWFAGEARRVVLAQIKELEKQITIRRIRESILGVDNGWLANIDAQIATLRSQLK
jgi:hypothetical protein